MGSIGKEIEMVRLVLVVQIMITRLAIEQVGFNCDFIKIFLSLNNFTLLGFYMNIEYRGSGLITPAQLYSVEFPQASSTCQLKFWHVNYGGQSPVASYLSANGVREALLYRYDTNGNSTSWKFASVDLGWPSWNLSQQFKFICCCFR